MKLDKHTAPNLVAEFERLDKLHAKEDRDRKTYHSKRNTWHRVYGLMRMHRLNQKAVDNAHEFRDMAFSIHARLARLAEAMTTDYRLGRSKLNQQTFDY